MKKIENSKWFGVLLGLIVAVAFFGSLYSYGQQLKIDAAEAEKNAELESKKVYAVNEVPVPEVPDIKPTRATGVITAEEWAAYYPNEYASHALNANNIGSKDGTRHKYPDDNPNIQTLYKGMAFSFDYGEAVGHSYTLQDIAETTRPHKLANCLTCKTPDLTALVNSLGEEVYATEFDTIFAQVEEPVSCYNCHANEPGTIHIVSDYMADAMGDEIEAGKVDAINVSCAQCHIEYYFDPTTKATKTPYDTLDNMNPDDILAFYNKMGFKDYTNENTGVGQIKVQHPEFETFLGEGTKHGGMFTCADCHMSFDYDEEGDPYVDHEFTSPLNNETLIANNCGLCHTDLAGMVTAIQTEITGREDEVSDLLLEVNQKFAAALEAGTVDEATAEKIRSLDRDAQFYWDFVYVENSEGAHNSEFAKKYLDKAEKLAKQALDLL